MNKGKTSNFSGITLIALVITVIVLLILAGISISMLSGDNGILNKATDAKTLTERRSIIEQAQTDVLGYQAENKATDLKKSQLQSVLEKYFKNVPDLTDMQNSEILGTKLDTLAEYGNHNIEVKEIFNGNLLEDIQTQVATADEINAKIGTVVTGYSAKDIEWQVYYADNNETFLISKTLAKTNYTIPVKGEGKSSDYSGSVNVRSSAYGAKWNEKWLAKCTADTENGGESARANAKLTAYLCDPDNWNEYKTGSASYAVGGPTIELLIASWNKSQGASIDLIDSDVIPVGYFYDKPVEFAYSCIVTSDVKNGVYNPSEDYWLASPCILDRHDNYVNYTGDGDDMRCVYSNGSVSGMPYYYRGQFWSKPQNGVRPIVSIPTSKINIEGDTVTVLP